MKSYPISDHFDGSEFYSTPNIVSLSAGQTFGHILWGRNGKWPDSLVAPFPYNSSAADGCINVTWVGHATTLIQIDGINILTDPVWSDRVGPLSFFGPKRISPPGIEFENLPKIDLVLISHDHYDHLDIPTLRRLEEKFHPVFVVPLGIESTLESLKLSQVQTLDWWAEFAFKDSIHVTLTPAQHNSGRGVFDKNKTLWGGFVITSGQQKVFFAGDTAWGDHFEKIHDHFGSMSVALLPIGAYKPEFKMSRFHISPAEAVKAASTLHAELSIPIHYNTFQLTAEDFGEPLRDLETALLKSDSAKVKFAPLRTGESICYSGTVSADVK